MATARQPRGLELEPLNLTPLLDVLFNLIFFFLLATQLKEEQRVLDVQLPKSGVHRQAPKPQRQLTVTVSREGKVLFQDDFLTTGQLKQRLEEIAELPGQRLPVLIRSDHDTPFQFVMDILTVCYETGHTECAPIVKPAEREP